MTVIVAWNRKKGSRADSLEELSEPTVQRCVLNIKERSGHEAVVLNPPDHCLVTTNSLMNELARVIS